MAEAPLDSIQDAQIAKLEARQESTDRGISRLVESIDKLNIRIDGLRMPSSTLAAWAMVFIMIVFAAVGYVVSHTADGHPDRVLREIDLLRNQIERGR